MLFCNYNKTDITPEGAVLLAGFANRRGMSDHVHSRLYSHCIVVGYKEVSACIISNDLLDLSVESVGYIADKITEKTGLPKSSVFIHSIHTHSAPSMADSVLKNPENCGNIQYKDFAIGKIVANAVETINSRSDYRQCRLKAGTGNSTLGICRREIDPVTGMAVIGKNFSGGAGLPLNLAEFEDISGKPFLTLFNYPCHPVTLNEKSLAVSSDFAGIARCCVEQKRGTNAVFFNAAAGDINPCYPLGNDQTITERAGQHLCSDVLQVYLKQIDVSGIKIISRTLSLPFKNQNQTVTFIDREVERKSSEKTDFVNWRDDLRKWGDFMKQKLREGKLADFRSVRISVVKIGRLILFFSQGEVFSAYQKIIRERFPDHIVMFIGYTDGKTGYLPDSGSFKNKGYEVEQAYIYVFEPSPLDEKSCDVFLNGAVNLISAVV